MKKSFEIPSSISLLSAVLAVGLSWGPSWVHAQSTAAGPLLLIDFPLSLLSPFGRRPPDPQPKTHAPAPAKQNVS